MVKNICKDEKILCQISQLATTDDINVGMDLLDTIKFHKDGCVGMAANMIGVLKRILVFEDVDRTYKLMYNPTILTYSGEYETTEGCLSLNGVRSTKRYNKIKVEYYNERFQKRIKTFAGFIAQIIQHEIDHMNGIII